MQGVGHIASTLKRCKHLGAFYELLIYLRTLKTPHPKMRSISIIPCFKLLNITTELGFIKNGKSNQIKEIAEVHVMLDGLFPPNPALSLRPQHYGMPWSLSFSLVGALLAHTAQTTNGTRESWKPIQKFLPQCDCSKLYKRTE